MQGQKGGGVLTHVLAVALSDEDFDATVDKEARRIGVSIQAARRETLRESS